jgi:YHS domain-containing protein
MKKSATAHIGELVVFLHKLNCLSSMKKYFLVALTPLLFVLFSCHSAGDKPATTAAGTDTAASGAKATQEVNGVLASLKNLPFAYNRDPSCGMPLKAGLEDTTTYKGKLYGFCSKECKDAFLKDPAGYTAKLK